MNTKKWKTKSGQKIRIKDLTDEHLINIIRKLESMHDATVLAMHSLSGFITAEIASEHLEREIDSAENEGPSASFSIYNDLKEEAQRRGIQCPTSS